MSFISIHFLIFFIGIFLISIFIKQRSIYPVFLTIVSFIFYGFFNIKFCIILILLIFINFIFSKLIYQYNNHTKFKRFIFSLSLITNTLILGIFKYYNFFIESAYKLDSILNINFQFSPIEIILPIGISFYIFKIISHNFDVYRGKLNSTNFFYFASYISFFPQLLSGPIMRAKPFYNNLKQPFNYDRITIGLLIASGLFKKLVLSSFFYKFIQDPFLVPLKYSPLDMILATLALGAYIYTDFSGYSDLSNAMSNLLGFNSTLNFNYPYTAKSLTEFWRKWHISLSLWLKDYIYIPLGGNRKGRIRTYLNLLVTMIIGGFWHGANITFLIWGTIHGIGLIIDKIMHNILEKIKLNNLIVLSFIKFSLTFIFIHISWIIFFSNSTQTILDVLSQIFKLQNFNSIFLIWQLILALFVVYFMMFWGQNFQKIIYKLIMRGNFSFQIIVFILIFYIIFNLAPKGIPPFVYFKF